MDDRLANAHRALAQERLTRHLVEHGLTSAEAAPIVTGATYNVVGDDVIIDTNGQRAVASNADAMSSLAATLSGATDRRSEQAARDAGKAAADAQKKAAAAQELAFR